MEGSTELTREVFKAGWVKLSYSGRSTVDKGDTLQWLVFCVHSNRIPLLESYSHAKEVSLHSPIQVVDLFDCSYVVRAVADDCALTVGFEHSDREPLEMTTVSVDEREGWIQALTTKLCTMGYLRASLNLYTAYPHAGEENRRDRTISSSQHSNEHVSGVNEPNLASNPTYYETLSSALISSDVPIVVTSTAESLNTAHRAWNARIPVLHFHDDLELNRETEAKAGMEIPALPPRVTSLSDRLSSPSATSKSSSRDENLAIGSGNVYDVPSPSSCQRNSLPRRSCKDAYQHSQHVRCLSERPSSGDTYDIFTMEGALARIDDALLLAKAVPQVVDDLRRSDSLPTCRSFYKSLNQGNKPVCSPSPCQPACYVKDAGTRAKEDSDTQMCDKPDSAPPVPLAPPPLLPPRSVLSSLRVSLTEQEVLKLKTEVQSQHALKTELNTSEILCVAFVRVAGFLWIAGWQMSELSARLRAVVHIGDRVIAIDGHPVECEDQIKSLLVSRHDDGRKLEVVLKRMPMAKVYLFKRAYDGEDIGLITKKGKNEIIDVVQGSIAWKGGFRQKTINTLNPDTETTWYITEVNGRPVSIFSKHDECKQRLLAIGKELSVVVQPTDFIKQLKRQFKLMKRYKDFVVT